MTWNVHRATAASACWTYLEDLNPDIALLQEVGGIPRAVSDRWRCIALSPVTKAGRRQRFSTAVLVKGQKVEPLRLTAAEPWVQAELTRFAGNLVASRVSLDGELLNVVSVYSPAWPVDRARIVGLDTGRVKLKQNPDVWVADLLLASLRSMDEHTRWIVGGDFNLSETFDAWRGGPRGNREYLDRAAALGLAECLRTAKGALVPTFRNTRGGRVVHQMDHLFVSKDLAQRVVSCDVGLAERVFGGGLSDHLPIIAELHPRGAGSRLCDT